MLDLPRRKVIEDRLAEIGARLRAAAATPASRELRVRHGALARVVFGWGRTDPHEAQLAAMLECVLELEALVERRCVPAEVGTFRPPRAARPSQNQSTKPPPRRATATLTTRPPPRRHDSAPPSSSR